jgi:hypothetical protein
MGTSTRRTRMKRYLFTAGEINLSGLRASDVVAPVLISSSPQRLKTPNAQGEKQTEAVMPCR